MDKELLLRVKEIQESERAFIGVATAEVVDRDGEVVLIDGIDYTSYMKNPVVFYGHERRDLPIGRTVWLKVSNETPKKLIAKIQIHDKTERSKTVWELIKEGYLQTLSIGFIVRNSEVKDGVRYLTEIELLEISVVPMPANPEAVIVEVAQKDFELAQKMFKLEFKGAVAPHSVDFVDEDEEWDADRARKQLAKWASSDGSGEKDKIDWSKYRRGFAWYDEENEENFSAYKLPHHYVVGGELKTCWRGVAAAMAALLGARGGVDIPSEDIEGVYRHLAKHYRDLGKEPPEMTSYTPIELEQMFGWLFTPKELRKAIEEIQRLKNFIVDIIPSLSTAEPSVQTDGDGSRKEKVRIKIKGGR